MGTLAGNGRRLEPAWRAWAEWRVLVVREPRVRGMRGCSLYKCGTIDFAIKVRAQNRDLCQKWEQRNSRDPPRCVACCRRSVRRVPESWRLWKTRRPSRAECSRQCGANYVIAFYFYQTIDINLLWHGTRNIYKNSTLDSDE